MATPERRRLGLRVVLLGAAGLLLAGAFALFATAPRPEVVEPTGARPMRVDTLQVQAEAVRPRARLAGVLEPRRDVELFSETRGRILAVGAEELDRVSEGQVLLQVDPTLARISVERAEASLARTRSELELARLNLERRRSLVEREVASEAQLDAAENAERIAAAALREARAQRDEARDQLAKKTLAAPFDGVLRQFPVEVGEYVREGQQVGEILDLSAVRISAGLSDRQIVAVSAGAPARVDVEAFPGEAFAGSVLRVGSASDPGTKKFPVEVEVPNPDTRLLPGMVARVNLDLGSAELATLIPRDATVDEFGLRFVFLIETKGAGSVVRRQRIEVRDMPFRPGVFAVLQGLTPGDRIAITGIRQLRDGAAVEPRPGAGS
jgi:membrane fusion protein (multidrug efflux system)